ncbi:sensor histidine kinase [Porphyromonas circumdentaria]|uniref:histidine kinase n=1 Tax=Porphyromonas circumdentaria TaxID=29524 RepID=A0A1T4NDJ2_9PORP|nr:HAMP domain-containing sensor histidine kinase [Porphyromonas circumdentaria]MBB6275640.1 signal transduction histidine kinase [Porphyromonas circumdentaria]MDO4721880.1 HAMP domain-containing sensor histidine kinase [Porphyromonas circumdentaria]SJZ77294.1 two-component system, OmpR family, phosphate regulon sensor histidine kinase PhoR [Porphyromonas circumdentaria]
MKKKRLYNFLIVLASFALSSALLLQIKYMLEMKDSYNDQFFKLAQSAISKAKDIVEKEAISSFVLENLEGHSPLLQKSQYASPYLNDPKLDEIEKFTKWGALISSSPFSSCPPWMQNYTSESYAHTSISLDVQKRLTEAYFFQHEAISDIILSSIINLDNDMRPMCDKISHMTLLQSLKRNLASVGIEEPFVYKIYDRKEKIIYEMGPPYGISGSDKNSICLPLFDKITIGSVSSGFIQVIFYDHNNYQNIYTYAIPSVVSILTVFLLFVIAVVLYSRQQRFEKDRHNFVHNMTHELKTPVTSIKLASSMLSQDSIISNKERSKKILEAMQSEAERLFFLADKILQFTLINEGKVCYHFSWFDCTSLIEHALTLYRLQCERLGGSMEGHFSATETYVHVDKIHLQNVIFNLLENAIKYRKTDVPPILSISMTNPAPNILRIAIKDNGIGIAKADQKSIFRQYFRVDTGNVHDTKGFGLGLAYVAKTVKDMGGKVGVESKLNAGTTMIVDLPAEERVQR